MFTRGTLVQHKEIEEQIFHVLAIRPSENGWRYKLVTPALPGVIVEAPQAKLTRYIRPEMAGERKSNDDQRS